MKIIRLNFLSKLLIVASSFLVAAITFGFLPPKHSKLSTKVETNKNGLVNITFLVQPNKGMTITEKAPWELKIKGYEGLKLEGKKMPLRIKKFDPKLPGFSLSAQKTFSAKGKNWVLYEIRSFICTKDKSTCYPELHKGKLELSGG